MSLIVTLSARVSNWRIRCQRRGDIDLDSIKKTGCIIGRDADSGMAIHDNYWPLCRCRGIPDRYGAIRRKIIEYLHITRVVVTRHPVSVDDGSREYFTVVKPETTFPLYSDPQRYGVFLWPASLFCQACFVACNDVRFTMVLFVSIFPVAIIPYRIQAPPIIGVNMGYGAHWCLDRHFV